MDEATFAALEKWAADEFRSVNGQLEWLIAKALKEAGRLPKSAFSSASTDSGEVPSAEQPPA